MQLLLLLDLLRDKFEAAEVSLSEGSTQDAAWGKSLGGQANQQAGTL